MRSLQKILPQTTAILLTLSGATTALAAGKPKPVVTLPDHVLNYAAKDSTQAQLEFSYQVEFEFKKTSNPSMELARQKIEAQLTHLFGTMAAHPAPAVPLTDHSIADIHITRKPGDSKMVYAQYRYSGTIAVKNGPSTSYEIVLPINADTVYADGMVGEKNPCTDPHYQEEGDFWYFWSPSRRGCQLVEGIHYVRIQAALSRTANTEKTYPEYDRLVGSDGIIRVSLFFGMDDVAKAIDPRRSADLSATNYRAIREKLIKLKYEAKRLSQTEIEGLTGATGERTPFVEELTRKFKHATVAVRLFFGPSGFGEESKAFHHFVKDSLENDAVMIYDGHSGLGGNLDLESIEASLNSPIKMDRNRYQILFFNSCTSYSYFNAKYLERKQSRRDPRGTKNLDIITTGLATSFFTENETNLALIQSIADWAAGKRVVSYQELARQIDTDNLLGVNGDEDNPTTPPRH